MNAYIIFNCTGEYEERRTNVVEVHTDEQKALAALDKYRNASNTPMTFDEFVKQYNRQWDDEELLDQILQIEYSLYLERTAEPSSYTMETHTLIS